jgi:kelch-like protein 10
MNEKVVWEATLHWVNYKKDYRQYKIGDLLSKIRTGYLNRTYFQKQVKDNELVAKSVSCTPIVNATEEYFKFGKTSTQLISTPNITRPRTGYHSSEVLFTFGGISEDDQLDDYLLVEFYDNKTNRWIRIDQYEEPRAYNGTVAIGYEVALIGGCYCGTADNLEYLNSCKAFDTISKTWRDLAPLHVHRGFVSSALLGRHIYALGGVGVNKRVLKSVEQYDIEQNLWTTIEPMNEKRAQACATSIKDKLFVMGGWNEQDWLSSVESYDTSTNQWTILSPMHQVRAGASCVTYHNQVYVIGGYNGEEVASSGEKYDPESETWQKIPEMFEPLSEFSMTVFQDKIFCIGGEKCEEGVYFLTDDVICFDSLTNHWKKMMRMSVPRHALSACVVKFPCLNGCESS